jgi:hypothetical protein
LTVTEPVPLLFTAFGSPVVELMVALRFIVPAVFGATELIVMMVVALAANVAAVHVAVVAVFEHVKAGFELIALVIVPDG